MHQKIPFKKLVRVISCFALITLLVGACSVQKRRYQKGFYVSNSRTVFKSRELSETKTFNRIQPPDTCATIEFTDGTTIKGNIIASSGKDITYRYCMDDGRDHRSLKQRIKSITYANGIVEHYAPDTRPETPVPLTKNDSLSTTVEKNNTVQAEKSDSVKTYLCDHIIFRDGTEDDVVIKIIDDETVRYKLCSMPNGPDFVRKKSTVFMIRYRNGQKDIFKESNPVYPEVRTVNQNRPDFKTRETLAMVALSAAILGIYPLTFLGSVVGLICSLIYLQKHRIDPKLYPAKSPAKAALIISLIMLGILALILVIVLGLLA